MKRSISIILALVLAVAAAALATSCTRTPEAPPTDQARQTLPMNNMAFALADSSDVEIHEFQLGDAGVTNNVGNPVPSPLGGIIAVPPGDGEHPLVVILHGVQWAATAIESVALRTYSGFDYLVQQLAAQGFVAMSINVGANYTFDFGESIDNEWAYDIFARHMELLTQANEGEDVGHGVDLSGRIDLEQVHLIGHSRGGEVASSIYHHDSNAGNNRVRSILRVATTATDDVAPDIPIGIIISELDGDVFVHDGQLVFDQILMENTNQSFANLVYLRGANHNFFNRMTPNDDREREFAHPDRVPQSQWLTREQHEGFLKHYASAFLAVVTGQTEAFGAFSSSRAQPATMFERAMISSTYFPMQRVIAVPSEESSQTVAATGSATVSFFLQSWEAAEGFFWHPAVQGRYEPELPLYALAWDGGNGAAQFNLTAGDFSAHDAISLYVAIDSSNALNAEGEAQAFTVTLTDGDGTQRSVLIPAGTSALSWHGGYTWYDEWMEADAWAGVMPLSDLRIPLAYFDGVDLRNVTELTITFDQTASGSVMLSGIYLK
ncbi:MAG: hypothetical protein FWD06_04070 [Oscillospiraceae bacterium]|nr:hypothetical protein [Oscillospiraceae bacterium]